MAHPGIGRLTKQELIIDNPQVMSFNFIHRRSIVLADGKRLAARGR